MYNKSDSKPFSIMYFCYIIFYSPGFIKFTFLFYNIYNFHNSLTWSIFLSRLISRHTVAYFSCSFLPGLDIIFRKVFVNVKILPSHSNVIFVGYNIWIILFFPWRHYWHNFSLLEKNGVQKPMVSMTFYFCLDDEGLFFFVLQDFD